MSVNVILTLTAKEGMFETLESTIAAILPETAARDDAKIISAASDAETANVVVYQLRDKIESQQAYIGCRQERGDLDKFGALLVNPPDFKVMKHIF